MVSIYPSAHGRWSETQLVLSVVTEGVPQTYPGLLMPDASNPTGAAFHKSYVHHITCDLPVMYVQAKGCALFSV
jgi:hypothetical protein